LLAICKVDVLRGSVSGLQHRRTVASPAQPLVDGLRGRLCRQNQERPEKAPELEIVALSYQS
jgi:hypothetical protein